MNAPEVGSAEQPFPTTRPEIVVTPTDAAPFVLDDRRMPGFAIEATVGAANWMGWYDPPDWQLTSASYMKTARPAKVHGIECLEFQGLDWEASECRWKEGPTHFARLTDETFEWLAFVQIRKGERILRTFLDDGFDQNWVAVPRRLEDTGRLVCSTDGTYTFEPLPSELDQIRVGAGMFNVCVGDRRYECLRDIHILRASLAKGAASLERGMLAESFYTRTGEQVLFRRYNGRRWQTEKRAPHATPWDERLPGNAHLVINGAMFVHWYDCLTDVSIGIDRADVGAWPVVATPWRGSPGAGGPRGGGLGAPRWR